MAETKSSASSMKASAARTTAKAKTVRNAAMSSMVGSLDELSDESASAFELQRALGRGAVRSQSAEVKRLTAKHGPSHPYVLAAMARADTIVGLSSTMGELTRQATHVMEDYGDKSVFHGYVFAGSGDPAPGLIVDLRLSMQDKPGAAADSSTRSFRATTDKEGYFRIALLQHEDRPNDPKPPIVRGRKAAAAQAEAASDSMIGNLFSAVRGVKDAAVQNIMGKPAAERVVIDTGTGANAGTDNRQLSFRSEVRILDGKEKDKVLYTDPMPPEFTGNVTDGVVEIETQFRMYGLA